jgi:Arc/MetJ-type ribon-helix-helix transcriptional regulator
MPTSPRRRTSKARPAPRPAAAAPAPAAAAPKTRRRAKPASSQSRRLDDSPPALASPAPSAALPPVEDEATSPQAGRGRGSESEKLTINLGAVDLGSIDLLVAEGFFSNRSDLIRTAVRNLLADHRDVINGALARQERTLGLRRITRPELEALRDAGQRIRIGVVGLAVIDDDVSADLARTTIAGLSVLGSLQASAAVRAALAGRLG